MDERLERLASASRVMFDQRLVDMRKENDDLRHQLAMLRFSPRVLNDLLVEANYTGLNQVCTCQKCYYAKRFSDMDPEELEVLAASFQDTGVDCIIEKCLKHHIKRLGLTVQDQQKYPDGSDVSDSSEGPTPENCDCHIVLVNSGYTTWEADYGARLCTTDFHLHPDLPALEALFTLIEEQESFLIVDGANYFALADDRD